MAMTVTRAQAGTPAEQWIKVETPLGTTENTSIDSPSANTFRFITGGTSRVQINNATTNIANNLAVVGTTGFTGAVTAASVAVVAGSINLDANSSIRMQNIASLAAAGSVQGNAAAIVTQTAYVTAADNTKGVRLPNAATGLVIDVYSSVAAKTLKVYPAADQTIDGGSVNAAVVIGPFSLNRFVASNTNNWIGMYQSNVAF